MINNFDLASLFICKEILDVIVAKRNKDSPNKDFRAEEDV